MNRMSYLLLGYLIQGVTARTRITELQRWDAGETGTLETHRRRQDGHPKTRDTPPKQGTGTSSQQVTQHPHQARAE